MCEAKAEVPVSGPPEEEVGLVAGHVPVLAERVLELLAPASGQTVVDATIGLGGHAERIATHLGSEGRLIGIDRDPSCLAVARERIVGCRCDLMQGNFGDLRAQLDRLGIERVDGILADLGVSSMHLDTAARGFSFRLEGPLDMRLDPGQAESASHLLARLSERELADIFWRLGEERYSRRIAQRIVAARRRCPLRTTTELAELVRSAIPRRGRGPWRIDPATRVFQALRIAVNDELGSLERLLRQMPDCLHAGGRAVVIAFHSLEDRPVKQAFRNRDLWEPLTKKPVVPTPAEIDQNPRARSAKLRAAMRVEW